MTPLVNKLVEVLREELQHYGQMLVCLEAQQESVLNRKPEDLLQSVAEMETLAVTVRDVRARRGVCQVQLADGLGLSKGAGMADLIASAPADYRPLLRALLEENRALLIRVQSRARQNHLLLARSVEGMRRFVRALFPGQAGNPTYTGAGAMVEPALLPHPICDLRG